MTSHDFASHMVCFIKSNLTLAIKMASFHGNFELTSVLLCVYLLVNKVAVLVSHVKSTNALTKHQHGFIQTYLIANYLCTTKSLYNQTSKGIMQTRCGLRQCFHRGLIAGQWSLRRLLIAYTIRTTGRNTQV